VIVANFSRRTLQQFIAHGKELIIGFHPHNRPILIILLNLLTILKRVLYITPLSYTFLDLTVGQHHLTEVPDLILDILKHLQEVPELPRISEVPVVAHVEQHVLGVVLVVAHELFQMVDLVELEC
jgi:hypothetical protein